MQIKLLLFIFILTGINFQTDGLPKETIPQKETDQFKSEMLTLVNQIRSEGCYCGRKFMPPAPPLTWNSRLEKAAKSHARDMNKNKFISHRGSDGSKIGDRISTANYAWQVVGENISWGHNTVEAAVLGWKNSQGHCMNLMSKSFNEIGAANEGNFWVQNFGREWE